MLRLLPFPSNAASVKRDWKASTFSEFIIEIPEEEVTAHLISVSSLQKWS